MRTFPLNDGGTALTFDDAGGVKQAAVVFGAWTTNAQGSIVVTKANGSTTTIAVEWFFDASNHLCIAQAGTQVFDFNGDGPTLPDFRLGPLATLFVKPIADKPFEFALQPQWTISPQHDLQFTIGARTSIIDGVISDNNSAFRYSFVDKLDVIEKFTLLFKGEWQNNTAADPGAIKYVYEVPGTTPALPPEKREFLLPNKLVVHDRFNVLAYSYNKAGRTRTVQLVGQFTFHNFELSYSIDRKDSSEGASTTLRFDVNVIGKTSTGTIAFALKRSTGAISSTTFTVGGKFSRQFKNGILDLTFGFEQQTIGGTLTSRELVIGGTLRHNGGASFSFLLQVGSGITNIEVAAEHLQLGPVTAEAKVTIRMQNGAVQAVTAMFGIAF